MNGARANPVTEDLIMFKNIKTELKNISFINILIFI